MPDAGEVRARVVIEYDGSGIEQAKRDLASLADMAGTFGGGAGAGAGGGMEGALGGIETQAASTALQLSNLAKAGGEVGTALVPVGDVMRGLGTSIQEMQTPLQNMPTLLETASSPFLALAQRTGTTVAQIGALQGAFEQLPRAVVSAVDPFQQIQGAVGQSVISLPQYAQSLQNVQGAFEQIPRTAVSAVDPFQQIQGAVQDSLPLLPQYADSLHQVQGAMGGAQQSAQTFAANMTPVNSSIQSNIVSADEMVKTWQQAGTNIFPTMTSAAQDSTSAAQDAFTAWSNAATPVRNMQELMGPSAFGPIQPAVGGFTGIMDAMKSGMMGFMEFGGMLFTAQMAGQAIGTVGQAIYNAAAIAEGPGAHSFGTFTGEVDALGAASQKSFGTFSEAFGKQLMPALQDFYALTSAGGGTGGLMGVLGTAASTMAQFVAGGPLLPMITGIQQMFGWGAPAFGPSGPGVGVPGGPGGAFFGAPAPTGTTGWQGTGFINPQTGAWTLNPAQAGQAVPTYAPNTFLMGPPNWVPPPPGQGPQPGIMGPAPQWTDVTGTHAYGQPGPLGYPGAGTLSIPEPTGTVMGTSFPSIHLPNMSGLMTALTSQLASGMGDFNFAGISLPPIHLPNMSGLMSGLTSQLASGMGDFSFGGISLPPIHLPNLSGLMSGLTSQLASGFGDFSFGSISIPPIHLPDLSGLMSQVTSQLASGFGDFSFGSISIPPIHLPDLSGVWSQITSQLSSGMGDFSFSGISIPTIHMPDLSGLMSTLTSQLASGFGSFTFSGISIPPINFGGLISSVQSAISSALSGLSALGNINVNIPGLPHFAGGVESFSGGLAVVGDAGPELLRLPAGSSVYPMSTGAGVSAAPIPLGVGGGGGGAVGPINITLQVDGRTFMQASASHLAPIIRLTNGSRSA